MTEIAVPTKGLMELFKNVASAEPNADLQEALFELSSRYTTIRDSQQRIYAECEEQTRMIIDEAKHSIVIPARVSAWDDGFALPYFTLIYSGNLE